MKFPIYLALAAGLAFAGCSASNAEEAAPHAAEEEAGARVEASASAQMSGDVGIEAGDASAALPEEIVLPEGVTVTSRSDTANGYALTTGISGDRDVFAEEIISGMQAKGWTQAEAGQATAQLRRLMFNRNGDAAIYALMESGDELVIQVTVIKPGG